MKAIKIDSDKKKVYEVELTDSDQINHLVNGSKETAHRFKTGDILFVDGDGAYSDRGQFKIGSNRYGWKTFHGNGVVVNKPQWEWASAIKTVDEIRRIVKFLKSKK